MFAMQTKNDEIKKILLCSRFDLKNAENQGLAPEIDDWLPT
jgi:hypothetical protein